MVLPMDFAEDQTLEDFDIRLLALLDKIRFLTGEVAETTASLAARLCRSATTVRQSLRRLETHQPPLARRIMATPNTMTGVELLYDRFGIHPSPEVNTIPLTRPPGQQDRVDQVNATALTGQRNPVDRSTREHRPVNGILLTPPIREFPESEDPIPSSPSRAREGEDDGQEGGSDGDGEFGVDWEEWDGESEPTTINQLQQWALLHVSYGDAVLSRLPAWVARVRAKVPAHASRAIDWVMDALSKADAACDASDPECIRKGGPKAYALACLDRWAMNGARPHVEQAEAEAQALAVANQPAIARQAVEKEVARLRDEEAARNDAAAIKRWENLPARLRDPIESKVAEEFPLTRRNKVLARAYCLAEMLRQMGPAPQAAPPPVAPGNRESES